MTSVGLNDHIFQGPNILTLTKSIKLFIDMYTLYSKNLNIVDYKNLDIFNITSTIR